VSKASPLLFLNTANGKHIKLVTLTVRKSGETPQDFYIIKMSDVLISSYNSVGNNGEQPVDKVSLNFGKIEFEYREQKADGSLGESVKAGWDLKANKGV
jgi:type VI secretion system secreted protein Hcp